MPRLIDAEEMMEYINSSINAMDKAGIMVDGEYLWGLLNYAIDNAPTVDAVEVVRCKECIYQAECAFTEWLGRNGNGFCSSGERK